MRSFLLIVCLLLLPETAAAQRSQGVTCVQEQLRTAGFDPGPSDGQVGPTTRRALTEFEQQIGMVSERELDASLGNSFCRAIGIMRPDLQEFWPSQRNGVYDIVLGTAINDEIAALVRASVERTYDAMDGFFGAELAGRDIIVVSDNANELFSLVTNHLSVPVVNLRERVADACSSRRWISGSAYPGLLLACIQTNAEVDRTWLDFFIGHEATHLLQYQLGGAVRVELGQEMRLRFEGPVWLYEGVAQAFGNRVAVNTPDWDFRIVNYRRLEGQFPDLSELELESALEWRQPEVYRAGSVGAVDLIDLYGYSSIAQFYENLGAGLFWDQAFLEAFGVSPEAFYLHYESVNRFDDAGNPITGPLSIFSQ